MTCQECNHEKGKCECLYCCSISQIGCVYCILPVLGYRQIKKILRMKKTETVKTIIDKIAAVRIWRNNSYTVMTF